MFPSLYVAIQKIREKAQELRDVFGDETRAKALEWAAAQITEAMAAEEQVPLTLTEAAVRSGYSIDHLGRMVRASKLSNAGRKGAPRIKATDIPTKPPTRLASNRRKPYDPIADARALRRSG